MVDAVNMVMLLSDRIGKRWRACLSHQVDGDIDVAAGGLGVRADLVRRVQELLREWDVETLVSPPYTPRYNGGIEAGIGALKGRTADHAARVGHPGHWTDDDVAAALEQANAFARPFGARWPSPADVWAARPPINPPEREHLTAGVARHRGEQESGPPACEGHAAEVRSGRGRARDAVRLALEECGYLHYTRRLIPPPIPRPKAARAS
jgi:hypothetical protein